MVARVVGACVVAMLVALVPAGAFAHPGHTHYAMGTIQALDAKRIVVQTTDTKTHETKPVGIALTPATTYRRGAKATDRSALRLGERVVVSYSEAKNALTAAEVRVGGK